MSIKSRRISPRRVSGVIFDVVHCGKAFTLHSALRARQEFWLFFAPQGRSAGILITIPLLFLWIFCPTGIFMTILLGTLCVPCRILRLNFPQNGTLRAPWHHRRLHLSPKRDTSSLSVTSALRFSFKRDSSRLLAFSSPKFSPKTGRFAFLGTTGA